ncbi:MAG: signal peptidase II [Acidobacteria bacterium]|nr:signal peptidase II [Acidobacteriota bacterium]
MKPTGPAAGPVWSPFLWAGLIVALDRVTKVLIEQKVALWDTIPVIPGILNIVYTRNRGAAFGLLNDAPELLRKVLLIGVSLVILGFIVRMLLTQSESRLALTLVLGGAVGNLYDRIVYGSVTDFIQVFLGSYEWPSFNVADSAICIGAGLLALEIFRPRALTPEVGNAKGENVSEAH